MKVQPSACQRRQHVRSDPNRQKPPFAHRVCFSQRHADLGVSSCSLLNHAHVAIVSYFFYLHLLCHFRFAPFAPRDNSFRFQAYTQHPSLFEFSNCQREAVPSPYSMRTPVFPQDYITEQPVGCALSLLRYVDSTMRVRVVDWWISVSNLQLATLSNHLNQKEKKNKKKNVVWSCESCLHLVWYLQLETDKRWSTLFLKSLSIMSPSCSLLRRQSGFKHLVGSHVPTIQHLRLLARSVVRTTKIFNLPFSFRKDEESHVAVLVARSPVGVSVAKHRAPVLQTCGLGRASFDTSKEL